ncbi:hypothetical protein RGQ29_011725 [Quercus rubra]|uniref:GDSL esterase/lipase 7 n=1 Tax=Quercus rubra TaxID=3512 RepID=A0AAN7J9A5_QUERU|nr:hypothetical protein RGQ29_011725 [Quercus rubra]
MMNSLFKHRKKALTSELFSIGMGKCLNLQEQIDLFQRTVQSDLPKHFKSSYDLSEYLSKSIFVSSIGSNDYINNYLQPNLYNTSKHYPPQPFAQLLVDALSQGFERLYSLGARKIVMFEIGPIGCIPSIIRKVRNKHNGQCMEEINQIVSLFNQGLPALLKNLTSTLQGSTFVLGQANFLGDDAIKHPSKYGLIDSETPCCITWENGTSGCIPLLPPCPHAYQHFFWDAFHLTETVYSVIATRCFNDASFCSPFNIKQLIQL